MIRFLLKKTFWDGWDNLLALALGNAAWVALAALAAGGFALAQSAAADALVLLAAFLAAGVHGCAWAGSCRAMAEGGTRLFAAWRAALSSTWRTGLLTGFLYAAGTGVVLFSLPYYVALGGIAGAAALGVILWLVATLGLALQWMPAVSAVSQARGLRALRMSFGVLAGNPALSLFLWAYNAFQLAVSVPLGMFAPGPSGLVLASVEALRLDMLRYRWLADASAGTGGTAQRRPPWGELLAAERERLGERKLREALFFGGRGKGKR